MIRFREIKGAAGRVQVGRHVAATLTDWTLIPGDGSFAFSATVKDADRFWISQTPRDLRLTFGQNGLVWRAVDLEFAEGRVAGTLPLLEA